MIDYTLPEAEDVKFEEFVKEVTSDAGGVKILVAKLLVTILQKGIGEETNKLLEENKNNREFMDLAKTMLEVHRYVKY